MKHVKLFEQFIAEAKDNLYLQLHKKYAEQIKGLKAGKIKKLTDLVSVQRWSMEDREDYFGMDSKKKKELNAEHNEERKLFKKYMAGDYEVMLPKGTEELAESTVNEAVSRATKIYQIATPAPKAMLVEELEDLFGDDYRHIVTEFDDDEGYESVLVFNLTKSDIKRIQEEIGDVLIWEYSIKKGKAISESAMIEALSKSDRKAIAYTMTEQDPSKIKDLQNAIGQDFSDNYSSTSRSVLVDVKKKGGKWVAITSETESEYNNKKPKKGKREATIGITWNAMFF